MSQEPAAYSDPLHALYARTYPKRPGIAVAAMYRVALAASESRGEHLNLVNNGVPVKPDFNAMRCPITECEGVIRMTEGLDVRHHRSDEQEATMEFWCPECGTSGTLTAPA